MLDEIGEAASAAVVARVRASFDRQGLMRLLGAELTHVGPGRVQIDLRRRPEVSQQHGYVHAGATSAIADSAGGYAALTVMPEVSEVLTVEYKLNCLPPISIATIPEHYVAPTGPTRRPLFGVTTHRLWHERTPIDR